MKIKVTRTNKYILPFSAERFVRSSKGLCISCKTSGRRVTMPVPRGKKERPTKLSSTELLPELCKDLLIF